MDAYRYDRRDEHGYRRVLEVRPCATGDRLVVDTDPHGKGIACTLPRANVVHLRDVLTAWLGDGAPKPAALTEDRVREILAEELEARYTHRLQGNAPIKARFINDPSPHDVGHAEDIWGPPCNGCTHSTGVHVSSGCTDPECGCTRMSGECAQPSAPAPDALCECGHLERVHSGRDAHCIEWISNALVCSCASYVRLVP